MKNLLLLKQYSYISTLDVYLHINSQIGKSVSNSTLFFVKIYYKCCVLRYLLLHLMKIKTKGNVS